MLLFRGICWAFIVLGAFGVGICLLFMPISIKGLKIRSTSGLEEQDAVYEQRKARLEA